MRRGALGRRFARLATNALVRMPGLDRVFRPLLRAQFDRLAPRWDTIVGPDHLAPLEAALAVVEAPSRALDLGTGTGEGAVAIARRFPEADVVGVDLSARMVDEARRKLPPDLIGRVRFEQSDASALPFDDGGFDLVALVNMIPFFDELARVLAPGGTVVFSFSRARATPIYVPFERLRSELAARGFSEFAEFAAGSGTALLARSTARL